MEEFEFQVYFLQNIYAPPLLLIKDRKRKKKKNYGKFECFFDRKNKNVKN